MTGCYTGEKVLVQNVVSKLWDRETVITAVRTAADKTIVTYNLDIGGQQSTCHRKFLRKIVHLPNDDEAAEEPVDYADKRDVEAGQVKQRGDRPDQEPLCSSTRLQSGLERRC